MSATEGAMRRLAMLMVLSAFPLKSELLPIRTYTTADGLAADRVDRIVADSRGFLWFCTPEGLSRFDGNRFVNYGVEEGLPALSRRAAARAGPPFRRRRPCPGAAVLPGDCGPGRPGPCRGPRARSCGSPPDPAAAARAGRRGHA